jgi:RNA polymerase sigma-70 factor (ECF subfamily)
MLDALIRANGIAAQIDEAGNATDRQHVPGPLLQDAASPSSGTVSYEVFTEVALRYIRQLQCAAQRLTQIPADADDLVQDSYRLALQHYHELRSLTHCRAWLYRILHRQAATRYRRQRSGPALVLIGDDVDIAGDATMPMALGDPSEHLSLREIRDAINALPAELRVAVMLRDIEGFSYAEIARFTHCPAGTVRSRIARARAKLMIALRTHAEECGIHRTTA